MAEKLDIKKGYKKTLYQSRFDKGDCTHCGKPNQNPMNSEKTNEKIIDEFVKNVIKPQNIQFINFTVSLRIKQRQCTPAVFQTFVRSLERLAERKHIREYAFNARADNGF